MSSGTSVAATRKVRQANKNKDRMQILCRFSADAYSWLCDQAEENCRSLSGEVEFRIEQMRKSEVSA